MHDQQKADEKRRANEQLRSASKAKFQAELMGVAETAPLTRRENADQFGPLAGRVRPSV
jgi:hypothetical protein